MSLSHRPNASRVQALKEAADGELTVLEFYSHGGLAWWTDKGGKTFRRLLLPGGRYVDKETGDEAKAEIAEWRMGCVKTNALQNIRRQL